MIDIPIIINEMQFLRNNAVNIYNKEEGIQKRNFIAQSFMNSQLFS